MGNFISKNLSLLLAVGALAYVYKYIDKKSDVITKPLGNALADVTNWWNGSHDIKREWAGFFLDPTKLDHSYKVTNERWLEAVRKLNAGNAALIDEVFDADMRVKPQYQVLLEQEVSPATIATINKG